MSQASNYLEAALLDHIHGIAAYSPPTNLYIGLFTAAPGEAGGGTEVSGGSYGRYNITNDASEWSRAGGVVTNDNLLSFAAATANWGTVTHWGIFDASSGGNLLIYGQFPSPEVVNNGSTFRISAGQIAITFSFKSTYLAGAMLDHVFGIATFSAPGTVYLRLYTANPTDAGGGTEVSGSGTAYAPKSITNDGTSWSRTGNVVSNVNDQDFATATAAYGTVTGRALWDAASGGNLITWAPLTVNQSVGVGGLAGFPAGQLRQTLD